MIYVESLYLPSFDDEAKYLYPLAYPFSMFSKRDLYELHFSNITIIYGGNGSGKSTLLNIINSKLGLVRKSSFYSDQHYENYINKSRIKLAINEDTDKEWEIPINSKIISSEDIINFILSIRDRNNKTEETKKELEEEYMNAKFGKYNYRSLSDYDELLKKSEARSTTRTKYIEKRTNLIRQYSNGESVLRYFDSELENDGIYLLDEPENCLSPSFQIELLKLISECSRYCGCQFIIATHSPFLLSMPNAKIYNLDVNPVEVCKWTELDNVRIYYDFFKLHEDEFI